MINKYFVIIILMLFVLGTSQLNAQAGLVSGGGEAVGTTSSSFSIGQTFYSANAGDNHSITEGVQQPYEISTLSVSNLIADNIDISIYPNPVKHILQIEMKEYIPSLAFRLYDANGKLLQEQKLDKQKTAVNVAQLSPAIYFITIMRDYKTLKTFKLIKN